MRTPSKNRKEVLQMSKSSVAVRPAEMQRKPKGHSFKLFGRLLSYLFHYYKGRICLYRDHCGGRYQFHLFHGARSR